MVLFKYINNLPLRIFSRHARLQVFQNAIQIVDPERIRNIGIIAHIDAGIFFEGNQFHKYFKIFL